MSSLNFHEYPYVIYPARVYDAYKKLYNNIKHSGVFIVSMNLKGSIWFSKMSDDDEEEEEERWSDPTVYTP
jgi:hypothetical protein